MKELNEEDDEKLPVRKNFSGNNRKHFYSRQNHSFFFRFLNIKYREKRERMKKKKKEKKKTKVEHRRSLTLRSFLKQIKDVLGSDSNIERNSTEIYF